MAVKLARLALVLYVEGAGICFHVDRFDDVSLPMSGEVNTATILQSSITEGLCTQYEAFDRKTYIT